jgi:hypothetical protein
MMPWLIVTAVSLNFKLHFKIIPAQTSLHLHLSLQATRFPKLVDVTEWVVCYFYMLRNNRSGPGLISISLGCPWAILGRPWDVPGMSLGCPWDVPGPKHWDNGMSQGHGTSLVPGGHLGCPKLIFGYFFEIFFLLWPQ